MYERLPFSRLKEKWVRMDGMDAVGEVCRLAKVAAILRRTNKLVD